jgi:hypothetical protein
MANASSMTVALAPAASTDPVRNQLITLLKIPVHLTTHSEANLFVAYKRYLAHGEATKALDQMVSDGLWPGKRPIANALITVFTSKTTWFSSYRPTFPKVYKFPDMVRWLENAANAPSNLEVWGFHKSIYTFKDLMDFIDNGGKREAPEPETSKRAGKRKADGSGGGKKAKEQKRSSKKDHHSSS